MRYRIGATMFATTVSWDDGVCRIYSTRDLTPGEIETLIERVRSSDADPEEFVEDFFAELGIVVELEERLIGI